MHAFLKLKENRLASHLASNNVFRSSGAAQRHHLPVYTYFQMAWKSLTIEKMISSRQRRFDWRTTLPKVNIFLCDGIIRSVL